MVESCSAVNCTNRRAKGIKMKFHRFPKDPNLRKLWLHAIRRVGFTPSPTSAICEKHFTIDDYEVNVHGNKVLKKSVVPSIFDLPVHLRKEPKQRRVLKRKHEELTLKEPDQTMSEVVEKPEHREHVDYENMLEAGPSNLTHNPESIESESCETLSKKICSLRTRREPVYFGDFKFRDLNNMQRRIRFWKVAQGTVEKYKKVNKYNQCKIRRQRMKIKSLNSLLDELLKQKKISSIQSLVLKESLPETQKELLFRQLKRGKSCKYTPELRCFALTLNFYSAAAYNYTRKVFGKKVLPHPRTMAKWYSVVDGTPGYSAEALRAVKIKVDIEKQNGKKLVGALMMDEMFIHQHVHWTGSRSVGYINFGVAMECSEEMPKATRALVFMVVGINSKWKVPIAYFLINSSSAEEKAAFVKGCLLQLESTGILIKSLTFDGDACNILMASLLGAKLTFPSIEPFFINHHNQEKIHIILDACHMIKLVRNTLGDYRVLKDCDGNEVKWEYFKDLVKLQEESGLHCATKLRRRHLNYHKEKMRVKLAVQTFSSSVSDALDYCTKDLNIYSFQGAEATATFCRHINNIFDMLNTRNFLGNTQFKKPLYKDSEACLIDFVNSSISYLSSLTDLRDVNILKTSRKTGFLGLIVSLISIKNLFVDVVKSGTLNFLLTYKLSQDHLEMFFAAIRRRGGFSNNPTAWQFEQAYKRLLIHSEITSPDSANCLAQDATSILHVSSKNVKNPSLDLLYELFEEDFSPSSQEQYTVNHNKILNCVYICDIVEYIAGFISRKLVKTLNCNVCASSLITSNSTCMLLNRKNRGGLSKPTKDVVKICMVAESIIKTETNFSVPNVMLRLISLAMRNLNLTEVFLSLSQHCLDQDPLQGHIIQLVRLIMKNYFTIRLHHINSIKNEVPDRIRQKLTKAIHFENQ